MMGEQRRWLWCVGLLAAGFALLAGALAPAWAENEPSVAEVRFQGLRRINEQRLLNQMRTRPGRPHRNTDIQEDVRTLLQTRFFADVRVATSQAADGVIVVFQVVERATIKEVIYEGVKHIKRSELDTLTGLRPGGPLDPALNWQAARAIERKLHEDGRLLAKVELLEGTKYDDLRVHFRVTEGPAVQVRDVRFEGNRFVSAARLKTQVDTDDRWFGMFGGNYQGEKVEADVAKLLSYYHTFGFFEAKVQRKVVWHDGQQTVDIVFVIDEGPQYLVRESKIAGNRLVENAVLEARNRQENGQPWNAKQVGLSAKEMQAELRSRGYIFATVSPVPVFHEDQGVVTAGYQVNEGRVIEGRQYRVGELNIRGNTVTQDRIIRTELADAGILPGQVFDGNAIDRARRNLLRRRIFKDEPENGITPIVEILNPYDDSLYKDVEVIVEEDRTGSVVLGAAVGSDSGASISIVLNERNFDFMAIPMSWDDWSNGQAFRGAGQELRIEAIPGTELSRYTVSWREPRLFDSVYSLGLSGYFYTRRFDDYDETRGGGRVTLGRRLSPLWSINASVRMEDVEVKNFSPFAPPDFYAVAGHNLVIAPRVGVVRDTRDSILRPTEGNFFEVALEWGMGDFSYPIATAESSQFWTVWERPDGSGRHTINLRGMVGYAGDDTPLFDRFYAGGFRSMRGFRYRGVGPRVGGFNVGGTFEAIGSLEYQLPLLANDKLYLVAFTDFGTVDDDISLDKFRLSAGFGFRIHLPFMGPAPVALDWGFPILHEDGDERRTFTFGIAISR